MAWAFRTPTQSGLAQVTSRVAASPALGAGEIMLASAYRETNTANEAGTPPSGWTLLGVEHVNTGPNPDARVKYYWKVSTAGDVGANYTWSWTATQWSEVMIGCLYRNEG